MPDMQDRMELPHFSVIKEGFNEGPARAISEHDCGTEASVANKPPRGQLLCLRTRSESAFDGPSLPAGDTRWMRLGQRIWEANEASFREAGETKPGVPEWLAADRVGSGTRDFPVEEEDLAMNFGIRLDAAFDCRAPASNSRMRLITSSQPACPSPVIEFSPDARTARLPALAGRLPAVPIEDRVLLFRTPLRQTTTLFSLTGGCGRSSIAANLARMLAAVGLRVLLADTCAHSLLPRLFGAGECRQGVLRNFISTHGSSKIQSIRMISLMVEAFAGDDAEQYRILDEFIRQAAPMDRVIWDLSGAPLDWAAKVLCSSPQILVPLLPEASSMMQLRATQRFLNRCHDENPEARVRYVLNHFDEGNCLHQEMHCRFRQLLGSQLLSGTLRSAPQMDESLAQGKTVIDHAPASGLADDLWRLVQQLDHVPAALDRVADIAESSQWFEQ